MLANIKRAKCWPTYESEQQAPSNISFMFPAAWQKTFSFSSAMLSTSCWGIYLAFQLLNVQLVPPGRRYFLSHLGLDRSCTGGLSEPFHCLLWEQMSQKRVVTLNQAVKVCRTDTVMTQKLKTISIELQSWVLILCSITASNHFHIMVIWATVNIELLVITYLNYSRKPYSNTQISHLNVVWTLAGRRCRRHTGKRCDVVWTRAEQLAQAGVTVSSAYEPKSISPS